MKKSKRTQYLQKRVRIFKALDILTWVGIAISSFILAMSLWNAKDGSGMPIFSDQFKNMLIGIGITTIVGIIAALIIKDKARTVVWMLSLIVYSIIFKETGMFCILGAWAIDEYLFHGLYSYYKTRLIINKEIDLRD